MSSSTTPTHRPVSLDELKRAWSAVEAGQFRAGNRSGYSAPVDREAAGTTEWTPTAGERTVVILGCGGAVGASTVAVAAGLAAPHPARVVECCSVSASGLAAASTAELGLDPSGWSLGKRDHLRIERASEVLTEVEDVPAPVEAEHENQLTILDVGWEVGALMNSTSWLGSAVRTADRLIVVTTATVPGLRRLEGALEILAPHRDLERVVVAVRGPRRKKWPRGVDHSAGPRVRRLLAADAVVEIPEDRSLATTGLDSHPVPAPLIATARGLLDPAQLPEPTN
ncbi:MAG: hypothetical protein L0H74_00605 [Brachybacterium sp.]|nr:hypothetical protein [Brachybacterium sp.]